MCFQLRQSWLNYAYIKIHFTTQFFSGHVFRLFTIISDDTYWLYISTTPLNTPFNYLKEYFWTIQFLFLFSGNSMMSSTSSVGSMNSSSMSTTGKSREEKAADRYVLARKYKTLCVYLFVSVFPLTVYLFIYLYLYIYLFLTCIFRNTLLFIHLYTCVFIYSYIFLLIN